MVFISVFDRILEGLFFCFILKGFRVGFDGVSFVVRFC